MSHLTSRFDLTCLIKGIDGSEVRIDVSDEHSLEAALAKLKKAVANASVEMSRA